MLLIDTVSPIAMTVPQTRPVSHQTVSLRLAPDVHQPAPVQLTLLLGILPGPGLLREQILVAFLKQGFRFHKLFCIMSTFLTLQVRQQFLLSQCLQK